MALVTVVMLTGCVRGELDRSVSHGNPAHAALEDVPVNGFPVDVELYEGDSVSGELLAVDDTTVSVLTKTGTRWIAKNNVSKVSVKLYASHAWELVGWTALGVVSTLSHGYLLIFTAPAWLLIGLPTAAASGASNHLHVDQSHAAYLWQFARFPAGLPPAWRGPVQPPLPPLQPDPPPAPIEPPAP
jgi:hypothetical protein